MEISSTEPWFEVLETQNGHAPALYSIFLGGAGCRARQKVSRMHSESGCVLPSRACSPRALFDPLSPRRVSSIIFYVLLQVYLDFNVAYILISGWAYGLLSHPC